MMVTLRFDFHMGRVEWVTSHVPESQSVDGGVKAGWGRLLVVGGRRDIDTAITSNKQTTEPRPRRLATS